MTAKLFVPAIALFVAACSSFAFSAAAYNNNKTGTTGTNNNAAAQKEPPHYDPVVIKFESAKRQRLAGNDVMVISGAEALSGKQRQFGVSNREAQDKKGPMKYDPKPEVSSVVEKMKPGEYLKVEIKADKYGQILWADKVSVYEPQEHEQEPNVYLWDGGYKDTVSGTDVFKIELVKMGQRFVTYVQMVASGEKGKGNVPDPAIVAIAEGIEKNKTTTKAKKGSNPPKEIVEATVTGPEKAMFVTSLDAYQAPRQATFTKVADAEVEGQKGQAVEIDEGGKTITAMIPGKLVNKRWVNDVNLLADAKKLKPGTAVLFKTREVEGKTYLRAIAAAPKEPAKPAAGKTTEAAKPKSGADQLLPDKK
jgi:hypothetical protein